MNQQTEMTDRQYTILVADDEVEVVDLVTMVLEMQGYKVLSAANGEEALTCVRSHRPDLILLDVRMPKMSGLDVLLRLAEDSETALIPTIMLSVATTYPDVIAALQRGAVAYLPKPFGVTEMVRLVARVLTMDGERRESYRQQALRNIGTKW